MEKTNKTNKNNMEKQSEKTNNRVEFAQEYNFDLDKKSNKQSEKNNQKTQKNQ